MHEKFCAMDPHGAGDAAAIKILREAGYTLTRHWFWIAPSPEHEPSDEETMALDYLQWEWDFGGLVGDEGGGDG
jgi:hypothetical protein